MVWGRQWKMSEVRDVVARRSAGEPFAAIAASHGTTPAAVMSVWARHGKPNRRPKLDPKALRRWHARGLSDAEVGARLGVSPTMVQGWRRKLDLPANGYAHPRLLAKLRARNRARTARGQGIKAMHADALAVRAAAMGWPGCPRPELAEVLEALHAQGPATVEAVRALITPRYDTTVRHLLNRCVRLGLVVVAGTAPGRGRGKLYALAPGTRKGSVLDPTPEAEAYAGSMGRVVEALKAGPATRKALAARMGRTEHGISDPLTRAVRLGLVLSSGGKPATYSLPEEV